MSMFLFGFSSEQIGDAICDAGSGRYGAAFVDLVLALVALGYAAVLRERSGS